MPGRTHPRWGLGLANAALLAVVVGCGGGGGTPEADAFSVTLPEMAKIDRGDIDTILEALAAGRQPPSLPMSASVFAIGEPVPDKSHPDWQDLMSTLQEVRDAVVDEGWRLHVVGCTDDIGTPEFNQRLSEDRAAVTREVVIELGYPGDLVSAEGRGICGSDPSERRIEVQFVPPASEAVS